MKRQLVALAASVLLLFSSGATPVSAAGQGACDDATIGNYFGASYQLPTLAFNSTDASKATIDSSGMWACDGWSNSISAISAWVALEPKCIPPNCPVGESATIIQVGVIACAYNPNLPPQGPHDVCYDHRNTLRYFYAKAGCGSAIAYPRDLTDVSVTLNTVPVYGSAHTFMVTREPDNGIWRYYLYVDSTLALTIPHTDPDVSCWAGGNTYSTYAGEVWNEGDSFGSAAGGSHVNLTSAQFSNLGEGNWRNTVWPTSGNCYKADNPPSPPSVSQHCNYTSATSMTMWNTVP